MSITIPTKTSNESLKFVFNDLGQIKLMKRREFLELVYKVCNISYLPEILSTIMICSILSNFENKYPYSQINFIIISEKSLICSKAYEIYSFAVISHNPATEGHFTQQRRSIDQHIVE